MSLLLALVVCAAAAVAAAGERGSQVDIRDGFCVPINSTLPPGCPDSIGPPCPRCYNNTMPDFTGGDTIEALHTRLLPQLLEQMEYFADAVATESPANESTSDYSIFTGLAGRSFLFARLARRCEESGDAKAKALAGRYTSTAHAYLSAADALAEHTSATKDGVSFFSGPVGVWSLGAVAAMRRGDNTSALAYIRKVESVFKLAALTEDICPLDSGKAGLIYAGLFLNRAFGRDVIAPDAIAAVAKRTVEIGLRTGDNKYLAYKTPLFNFLMIGQGHGSGGVIRMLLDVPEVAASDDGKWLKATLDHYVSLQLADGNMPTPLDKPYPTIPDVLVQWCHGAPGFLGLFSKAYAVYKATDPAAASRYLAAAEKASDATWDRGLLTKGLLFCHGVGGNAYMFFEQFMFTGSEKALWRGLKFVEWALDTANDARLRGGDTPNSMFQGSHAVAMLYSDLIAAQWRQRTFMPGWHVDAAL